MTFAASPFGSRPFAAPLAGDTPTPPAPGVGAHPRAVRLGAVIPIGPARSVADRRPGATLFRRASASHPNRIRP
jgi:hypothetical protein